jgi:hypothetical protein
MDVEMSPWDKLLEWPHSRGHFVQLYEADEPALIKNVGRYLWEGLRRGDGALVIVTPEHGERFREELARLGGDTGAYLRNRQLFLLDAEETLARFMAYGQPDWRLFEGAINGGIRQVHPAHDDAGLRAYGEMVGILWKGRQFAAAIRLEQFWNKLLEQQSFSLYCAYAIDVFGTEFQIANLDGVLCTHTHLVPSQPNGNLETALNLAMDEILGADANVLRVLIKEGNRPSWAVMPNAEAIVLSLRQNRPGQADHILSRARHHYSQLQTADLR